uniref:Uncharacterized protein n=1 Tax=Angiostrongylus cantonensis TaxID=6313 RepID=A0A0K0D5A6_ANGCA
MEDLLAPTRVTRRSTGLLVIQVTDFLQVHVSKRPVGSVYWSPHTLRNVPIGCDCMWPVDRYGHQEL